MGLIRMGEVAPPATAAVVGQSMLGLGEMPASAEEIRVVSLCAGQGRDVIDVVGTIQGVGRHRLDGPGSDGVGSVVPFDPGQQLFDFVGDGVNPL